MATERESFVEQVKDIIEKADEMLSEDVGVEPEGEQEAESMQLKGDGYYPESQVYPFITFYRCMMLDDCGQKTLIMCGFFSLDRSWRMTSESQIQCTTYPREQVTILL